MSDHQDGLEGQDLSQEQAEPFFRFNDPNGNEIAFKSQEELASELQRSYLQQSDYTRKTQDVAEQRKRIEAQEAELKDVMKRLESKQSEFEKYDRFVSERPDLYQYLQQQMNRPADPNVAYDRAVKYADEKTGEVGSKLEELMQWKQERELDDERRNALAQLKQRYGDFDENEINSRLQAMADGGLQAVLETALMAQRGSVGPVEMEKRAADSVKEKQRARVVSGGGSGSPQQEREYKSLDEAGEALKESIRRGALDLGE